MLQLPQGGLLSGLHLYPEENKFKQIYLNIASFQNLFVDILYPYVINYF